jgi:hypothetical protein
MHAIMPFASLTRHDARQVMIERQRESSDESGLAAATAAAVAAAGSSALLFTAASVAREGLNGLRRMVATN